MPSTKNYQKQGGAVWQIGGQLNIGSTGVVTLAAGAAIILPAADPHVAGALWNNAGTVTVSAG